MESSVRSTIWDWSTVSRISPDMRDVVGQQMDEVSGR